MRFQDIVAQSKDISLARLSNPAANIPKPNGHVAQARRIIYVPPRRSDQVVDQFRVLMPRSLTRSKLFVSGFPLRAGWRK